MTSLRRKTSTLLLAVYILGIAKSQAQLITDPPRNATTALGTNATFSCRGNGEITWEVSNTQILDQNLVQKFAAAGVYAPLPTLNFSELFMTGTNSVNNVTRTIVCIVAEPSSIATGLTVESEVVRLLVYAEPFRPSDLVIEVDGLNLVVTWTEPFSLQGEEISYVVSITNMATRENREFIVNTTSYVFTEPFGDQRNCEEYEFSIFSRNGYSDSATSIQEHENFPQKPPIITSTDVSINVSLSDGVNVTFNITSLDPCPAYYVTNLTINITEQDTNVITSISYDRVDMTVPYLTVSLDSDDGLVHYATYTVVIETENMIGSTVSKDITLYTTGLQTVKAVMELDGSITVTCTFATGASSTGCQVTIFNTDNTQVEILTRNITRQNGNTQATDTLNLLPDYDDVEDLEIEATEILNSGEIGDITITAEVNLPQVTTTTEMPIAPSLSPDGSNTTLIAAVSGIAVVLMVLTVLIIILVIAIVHRRLKRKGFSNFAAQNNAYSSTLTGSAIIERLAPTTEDTPMSLHNPGYTGEMAGNEPHTTGVQASYAEVGETQLIAQNRVATMEYDSVVPLPTLGQNSRHGHNAAGMGDRETQGQATSQNYQQNRSLENMSDVLYDTCRTGARVAIGGVNIRQPSSAAKNAPNDQSFEPGSVQYDSLQVVKVATGPAEGYSVLNWDSDTQCQRSIPDRVVGYETLRGGDTDRNDQVVLQDNMSYGELTPNDTVSESSSDSASERSPLPNLSGSTQQQCQQELYSRTSHVNSAQHTVVPTDPVTGYSTMMRDEAKRSSGSGAIPAYDVVNLKAKRTHIMTSTLNSSAVKEEEKYAVVYEGGITRNPLYQETDTFPDETRTVKSTLNEPSGPNFTVLAPPGTQYVNTVTVPTNPDTGYSSMIREKAPQSHTGPVPGYSTLQRKDETFTETERSCGEEKEVKNSINHSEGTEQDSRAEMSQLSDSG